MSSPEGEAGKGHLVTGSLQEITAQTQFIANWKSLFWPTGTTHI